MCRSFEEQGWEMELTPQVDRGAVSFRTIGVLGTHLHWFCECVCVCVLPHSIAWLYKERKEKLVWVCVW